MWEGIGKEGQGGGRKEVKRGRGRERGEKKWTGEREEQEEGSVNRRGKKKRSEGEK